MMARMETVEVVVAHQARATVRVGETFLKIDADQASLDTEVAAIALSPIPTPEVLWQKPPVFVDGERITGVIDWSEAVRAAWSLRSLLAIRWLAEHGFDPSKPGAEIDVLKARM